MKKEKYTAEKSNRKKWLYIGFGVAVTGTLSYFGWRYWKKKKVQSEESNEEVIANDFSTKPISNNSARAKTTASTTQNKNEFPLKKGSKGEKVKLLQNYLLSKLGAASLGKGGADGDFGTKTEEALKKAGLPTSIDESTFNVLTKGNSPDPQKTAMSLYAATLKKDFNTVISLLKTLRNTEDYQAVSTAFMNYRIDGVRQTLVNGLLNVFTDEQQKQAIRLAFSNMGLKYDSNKWSLSGMEDERLLITARATKVWKNPREFVNVPVNMVLGKEITKRGNHTVFESDRQYFLVPSKDLTYYKQ